MKRRMAVVLGAAGILLTLAGCGMFLSGAQPLTPPVISNLQIQPSRLRFFGGQVTLSVNVSDQEGVRSVVLEVQKPDGSTSSVAMEAAGADTYRATVNLPPNVGASTQQYGFVVRAEDMFGVTARSDPAVLEVEGISLPPGAPPI
ncbi:MAG: hypothetical protein HPY54_14795 [Chthonomonadetes bacterium]|nr:hypothetical protein [Chthonomonadetes bacterium]